MDVFPGHRRLTRRLRAPAIAVGNFDGVHLGHQHIVSRARAVAGGGEVAVLTFDPHPTRVLAPGRAAPLLTTTQRKLELLGAAGVDVAVVEPFDRALSELDPAAFARAVLADGLGAHHVLVGQDFRFGKGRAGTVEELAALGQELGFAVTAAEPLLVDGEPASSSRARASLAAGDVAACARVLGRHHDVDGVVVRGAGRGRTIGVPTANLEHQAEVVPALGIYAVWVERLAAPGRRIAGAASLGTNPTFGAHPVGLEVHLIDWSGDLYGARLRVGFVARLRGEERFADVPALVDQMQRDVAAARELVRQSGAL